MNVPAKCIVGWITVKIMKNERLINKSESFFVNPVENKKQLQREGRIGEEKLLV